MNRGDQSCCGRYYAAYSGKYYAAYSGKYYAAYSGKSLPVKLVRWKWNCVKKTGFAGGIQWGGYVLYLCQWHELQKAIFFEEV